MFKTRDFYLKSVYNINGKKIGLVDDIYIDFYLAKVKGFKISNKSLFSKNNYIAMENIIEIGEDIIVNDTEKGIGLSFKEIKDMEIIDTSNNLKGIVEDLIIDINDYSIKGIIVTSGIIDKMIKGKEVILLNKCILGEKYILYIGNMSISFKSMPHNMEAKNAVKKA